MIYFSIKPFKILADDLLKHHTLSSPSTHPFYTFFNLFFNFYLFVFGSNTQPISSFISLSFILPIEISNIKESIKKENRDQIAKGAITKKNLENFLSYFPSFSNYYFFTSILILISILFISFHKKIPLFIKIFLILIYYFKTIYIYSDLPNFPVSSFLCCIFYFSLGCLFIIFKSFRFFISSIFYSYLSSIGILCLLNYKDLNISVGLIGISFLIQNLLSIIIKRKGGKLNKKSNI